MRKKRKFPTLVTKDVALPSLPVAQSSAHLSGSASPRFHPNLVPRKKPWNEVVFLLFLPCFWQTEFLLVFTHHSGKNTC